eukprot:Awhi_evm1s10459
MFIFDSLDILGTALSISIRKTPSAFNESAHIGAAMYNIFMCVVIKSVVLYLTEASLQTRLLVDSLFTILSITIIVALVVTKKFYYILRGWEPDLSKLFRSSNTSSKPSKALGAVQSKASMNDFITMGSSHDQLRTNKEEAIKMSSTEKPIDTVKVVAENEAKFSNDITEDFGHVYD